MKIVETSAGRLTLHVEDKQVSLSSEDCDTLTDRLVSTRRAKGLHPAALYRILTLLWNAGLRNLDTASADAQIAAIDKLRGVDERDILRGEVIRHAEQLKSANEAANNYARSLATKMRECDELSLELEATCAQRDDVIRDRGLTLKSLDNVRKERDEALSRYNMLRSALELAGLLDKEGKIHAAAAQR